jgi:hypothetical protein
MISIEGLLEEEQGLSMGKLLTVKFHQPSHEFMFDVGMTFVSYPLVLEPNFESGREGGPSCPWNTSSRGTRCGSPSRGLVTSRSSAGSPYPARQLSMRKVVPTLTSNER